MNTKTCLAVLGIVAGVGLALHAYRRHQSAKHWQDLDERVAQWEADRVAGLSPSALADREYRIQGAIGRPPKMGGKR